MTPLRVCVIGAGAAGSAAAYALSRRGAMVRVFDQYAEGHEKGSSHGESRLIRLAYFEDADYVPLLRRAYEEWRTLEDACGEELVRRTGLLEAGSPTSGLVAGVERAAREFDLPLSVLSRDEIASRCAGLAFPADWRAIFEENAGYLLADRALAAFRRGALEANAEFCWNERVIGLDIAKTGLVLSTAERRIECDRVIIAPGPWADKTFAALGLAAPCPIRAIAKATCWFALRDGANCDVPFALEDEDGRFFYAIPAPNGGAIKVGAHHAGLAISDPDDARPNLAAEAGAILEFVRKHVSGVEPESIGQVDCLYEKSPDNDFVVDRATEDPRIAYAVGLSGHGFKFAPIIGEFLAESVVGSVESTDLSFLSAERFS